MKIIKKFVLICIATIMWVTPVSAANLSTYRSNSVKKTVHGLKKHVPPFKYGEMKDGLFVRTLEEEAQSIPGGVQNPIFWNEYTKMVEARKMDELTPEMKELGYVLLWGMPQLPLAGEESESDYKKRQMDVSIPGIEQTGYVIFSGTVEETITEPCYIAVNGIEGGYYKEFPLYKENGYVSCAICNILLY